MRPIIGMDLGTTNSVIAYGNLGKRGLFTTSVLQVERRNEEGGIVRDKTLPSVVMYRKDKDGYSPIVGDYAKASYGKRYGYVSKSVKSIIGVKENAGLNDEIGDKTPEEVAARILIQMLIGAKKQLFLEDDIKDVIITIPASFEPAQRKATIEAAKLAGIDIDNTHEILLYEPKAVIYNLVNLIENDEIPSSVLDISSPKNVLVYDLGGGTLDVTIHKVSYKDDIPYVEDIAISRYTKLGGDDFDELIAEDLYKRFEMQCEIIIPQNRKEEVMCRLRKIAERLKKEVSNYYENIYALNKTIDDSYEFSVDEISLFDDYSYWEEISLGEIKKMISKLMGLNLQLSDVSRIDKLSDEDINNIIYPVLDTLAKARAKEGDIKIDYVVLNGGMTKFYPIKERINEFFNLKSISITDPDLAVAQGAAYYHYCLHKYNVGKSDMDKNIDENPNTDEPKAAFNTATILNDTLSIGLKGEYIYKVAEAGTKLPFISKSMNNRFVINEETDRFVIELLSGRGKNKNLPNVKITSKIIKLDSAIPAGTEIFVNVNINSMKFIDLEVTTALDPYRIYRVSVDNMNNIEDNAKKLPRLETIEKISLNPVAEINNLKDLAKKIEKGLHSKNFTKITRKIEKQIERIRKAENTVEFYEYIIKELEKTGLNDFYRGYLYKIAASFSDSWDQDKIENILSQCKKHFRDELKDITTREYILNAAISFIEKYDAEAVQEYRTTLEIKSMKINIM